MTERLAPGICVTCRDKALPMVVLELDLPGEIALCRHEDGSTATVETGLLDGVIPGDVLLVQAGAALARSGFAAVRP